MCFWQINVKLCVTRGRVTSSAGFEVQSDKRIKGVHKTEGEPGFQDPENLESLVLATRRVKIQKAESRFQNKKDQNPRTRRIKILESGGS